MNNINNAGIINFLNPKLSPKVTCNAPVADDYEIENLVSIDYSLKSRGFLAYYSIKPPIEIEFEVLCSISINFIKLITTVGSQKCTGIEILAKNHNSPYVTLGKAIYDKPGVLFYDKKKYRANDSLFLQNPNLHTCSFNRDSVKTFLNATTLKIIIFRTEKSVPCLGSVEIWGTPARTCSAITVETIYKIIQSNSNASVNNSVTDKSLSSNQSSQDNENSFQIPDDFKDDLTFEIMTIPMTLPSGKTVDQSTLDKHLEVEKSFGRKPCDPFTGMKFSETCKPILNVALKSRIDMFLIQNAHRKETFNLRRIVGKSSSKVPNSVVSAPSTSKRKCEDSESSIYHCEEVASRTSNKKARLDSKCCMCEKSINLYTISCCIHIYCRNCVLECCKKLECSVCFVKFQRNNVCKYHFC